jgi:hypothetical protein
MKNKSLLILEITWIIVGIACIFAGIRSVLRSTGSRYIIFFIMALISFGFAWVRHNQRKKG